MESQARPSTQGVTNLARIVSGAALNVLIIVRMNFAAFAAAFADGVWGLALLLGLVPAPVPARRLVFVEARRLVGPGRARGIH